jgi:hypothetical protein
MANYTKTITVNDIDFDVTFRLSPLAELTESQHATHDVIISSSTGLYTLEEVADTKLGEFVKTGLNERLDTMAASIKQSKHRKTLIEAGFELTHHTLGKPKEILNG